MTYYSPQNVIKYDKAMEIVNKGKYHNATKNLICDYCMVSNLTGSWKLLETDDIDLCMNCFIKLRNNEPMGQQSLPVSGRITNNLMDIYKLPEVTLMMQNSVRPNTLTFMEQDSVRPSLMTRMLQDSVRKQNNNNNNIESFSRNNNLKYSLYNNNNNNNN